jgi:hypothetical protein
MSENVIEREAAESELQHIVDYFEVDPDGQDWEGSKARLLAAIMKGRIILDEDKPAVTMTLAAPIRLDNGQTVAELSYSEPTAGDMRSLDRFKDGEKMAKTIALASRMTGQPVGIIERMGARDLQTMGAIASLFF